MRGLGKTEKRWAEEMKGMLYLGNSLPQNDLVFLGGRQVGTTDATICFSHLLLEPLQAVMATEMTLVLHAPAHCCLEWFHW